METKKLIDCCEFISDGDHLPPPKSDSGVPFITISNITGQNKLSLEDTMFVPESYYNGLNENKKAQKGDILYSVVGSFGKPVYVDFDKQMVFQRHIAILRPKRNVNARFIYYTMLNPQFYKLVDKLAIGCSQRTVTLDTLRNIEISLPDKDIQDKTVEVLSLIDRKIDENCKINDNLATQALTLFSDFVSHLSKKLEQRKLGDVIASANTGGDAIQKVPIVDYDTGIKCARVGDITNAREYASWAFCNASKSVYDNYKLQAGDILVTRTATLGITQYIAKDISAVYNNGLIRLKVNDTNALPLYIYWAMKTSDFLNYINQMNSATSVRPNMKIDYLLNYQLSIPSIEEQTQFTNTVEPLMNAISLNNDEILKLSEFQAIILTTLSSR